MQHSLGRFVQSSLPLSSALLLTSGLIAQVTWSPISVGTPPARSAAGAASTLAKHDVLVFGGLGATGALGDTWRYDNQAWTLLSPAASPPPRSHLAMAMIGPDCALFGGRAANGAALGDLWFWSSAAQNWVTGPTGPPAREGAAFAGGPSALLFGGSDGAQTFGDTWRCVPFPTPTWIDVTPATGPLPRHGHALVYVGRNPAHYLLFGGIDAAGNVLADTWRLQQNVGGTYAWTQASPPSNPGPRYGHGMRWSEHRGRVQLFGGEGPGGVLLGDTWEWDGTHWLSILTTGAPSPRADAVFVDGAHAPLASPYGGLLVGGRDAVGPSAEVWQATPVFPASISGFGNTFSPLVYFNVSMPWVGSSFEVSVNSVIPQALAHVIAGFSNTTSPFGPLPISLGPQFNYQLLLVDPVVLLPTAPIGLQFGELWLAVPSNPSLFGAHLYAQAITFLPALGPVQGWITTSGVDFQLGWL